MLVRHPEGVGVVVDKGVEVVPPDSQIPNTFVRHPDGVGVVGNDGDDVEEGVVEEDGDDVVEEDGVVVGEEEGESVEDGDFFLNQSIFPVAARTPITIAATISTPRKNHPMFDPVFDSFDDGVSISKEDTGFEAFETFEVFEDILPFFVLGRRNKKM